MTIVIPPPQPKQIEFLKAKQKHIGFGGARGGGKSWVVRVKALILALAYPGIRMLLIRRTYPEIINNHLPALKVLFKGIARYNKTDKEFTFFNGSVLKLGYCSSDDDADQYMGVEYDVIFIDEATHLSEYQIKKISACCRGVNNFPKHIYYTMNPGGQGHGYIKRVFIDKRFNETEDPKDYYFIQSLLTDNKALMKSDPDYIKALQALPPKLRKAWLEGNWDIFEGQFFEEFVDKEENYRSRQWTHVIEPFEIPQNWTIYRSYDHGYNKPFSVGWWAVDEEGRAYRILEWYGCTDTPDEGIKMEVNQIFTEIKRIENEHRWLKGKRIIGVADPAIWQKDTGTSIADVANKHGVYFNKGDNQRLAGWMQFHYRLAFNEEGIPMVYIFNTCRDFIRTIPTLLYSETRPEDVDTTMEDHIADESRYFFMANPIKARKTEEKKKKYGLDPLELFKDERLYRPYNSN